MADPDAAAPREGGTSLTLLQRLRGNEPDAWRTTVHLYTPLVAHWCARVGVRGADADDVIQEVFRAAVAGLATFRRDSPGDSFRGWLRGITRHLLSAHFRQAARQPQGGGGTDLLDRLHEVPDAVPLPDDDYTDEAAASEVYRRALEVIRSAFEERTWTMFWRTAVDGRPPTEVAAEMSVSPAAVRQAKSRVLRKLKQQLGDVIA
jgi:RNA polymerase sigma-70 factor (ECF subfamily)